MSGDRSRAVGPFIGLVLAVTLSACSVSASVSVGSSELSTSKLAAIVLKVTRRQGLVAQHVSCPAGVALRKGTLSYCAARYSNGESSRFLVRQTDDKGNVYIRPAEMTAPAIENEIRVALRQRGITATAHCPDAVAIVVGKSFECTVSDAAQTGTIPVKITDATGGYTLGTITAKR